MEFQYKPKGVCARKMVVVLGEQHMIDHVSIEGGCHGNLQGISALLRGQRAEEIILRLKGICCKSKKTSCPDQLAMALTQAIQAKENDNK